MSVEFSQHPEFSRHAGLDRQLTPHALDSLLQALLHVRLECHLWKAHFIQLAGSDLPAPSQGAFRDMWDVMLAHWIPVYTPENYERYSPLFGAAIKDTRDRFERLRQVYARVLPRDVSRRLKQATQQLQFESAAWRWIPGRTAIENPDRLMAARFKGVIRLLSLISRDADQRLVTLVRSQD